MLPGFIRHGEQEVNENVLKFTDPIAERTHLHHGRPCLFGMAAMLFFAAAHSWAADVYQSPDAFLTETFAGQPPVPKMLWLNDAMQQRVVRILGHKYPAMRLRYWEHEKRSAWILEEIGKEEPITAGIVVDSGRIERMRVLIYRESRGDEVRYPFFTRQFEGAELKPDMRLDRHIDAISGATLSVRALERLARLALYLDGAARGSP